MLIPIQRSSERRAAVHERAIRRRKKGTRTYYAFLFRRSHGAPIRERAIDIHGAGGVSINANFESALILCERLEKLPCAVV